MSHERIQTLLGTLTDPHTDRPLSESADIQIDGDDPIQVRIVLHYAAGQYARGLSTLVQSHIEAQLDDVSARVSVDWSAAAVNVRDNFPGLNGVKNIIAVASGKGGVGKSTTAVNLALALQAEGARVGILDADIYGPSVAAMLGVADGTRPQTRDEKFFVPVPAHGLQSMSMAYLVTEKTPMVWRGPMVSGALQQLLTQTLWDNLDYLIIDMPPGTGDIQLTLAQKVPVSGAVIVTTPQDIALLDARKGIEMFHKVDIPVLGVVENMAMHVCSNCGHVEHIFGEGGGAQLATDYDVNLLESLPLDLSIRTQADGGEPTVIAEPDGEITAHYQLLARRTAAALALRGADSGPSISMQ
ncbi:ATP-binding protein [Saccharospirillum sp. MSK14-1]|uniref:iron-sulfur cluster carrier protein ApbC n=1 Tax=Saccharospirillum sp. MSK14-1 TaxID=1897632 RepID=UPI000D35FD33|nr:iron-sulfur cluster carrier protein ApbC [Saccharospirillum sp. MSK14-1]PTY36314.1 ATP-binding protein [Saccharospirillum sp. MSK14-1]